MIEAHCTKNTVQRKVAKTVWERRGCRSGCRGGHFDWPDGEHPSGCRSNAEGYHPYKYYVVVLEDSLSFGYLFLCNVSNKFITILKMYNFVEKSKTNINIRIKNF